MKYKSSITLQLSSILCLMTLTSGCGNTSGKSLESSNDQKSSKETTTEVETQSLHLDTKNPDVIIATDPSNAPFEMHGESGHIIGLNVDIVDAIAKEQGFTYNFKPRKWQNIFQELDEDNSDIITGLVVASDKRRQKYDFTNTVYIKKRYAYMTKSMAKTHNIEKFTDICSLDVAVKEKTDKSELYESVCGTNNPKMIPVSSSHTAFEKMVNGSVDVAIGDDILFNSFIKHNHLNNIVSFVDPNDQSIELAWPVKKGDTEVLEKFNAGLESLKNNGKYDQLVDKWLNH